ncbi:MAG TPA: queuosine precursor transporter [Gammaproteobacteria bacterium]|nr:queuosine precursor transporter [Gammaproteobacteria bacterium]
MKSNISYTNVIQLKPNFLWFLTLTYAMVIVLANWFDPRLIKIAGLTTDAGTLIFPLTFLLSDLITEVYGYKHARRAIWCGFLFNVLFIFYGQIVIHLPSPDYPTNNALFDTLLATNIRIILASSISYLISEPLNSYVMAKLKIKMHGRFISIRFLASTLFASGVDSFIFSSIAFYGVMNNSNLISLIITMWFIKVMIELIGLPLSIKLTQKLKQAEKIDIYDYKTKFNIFNLDANYDGSNNLYLKR